MSYLFAAAGSAVITGNFEKVSLPAYGIVAVPAQSPDFTVTSQDGAELVRMVAK